MMPGDRQDWPRRERWSVDGLTTIPALLDRAVHNWPDRTFLDFTGERRSFAEVDVATSCMARGLAARGVAKGDCVCVMLDNTPDLVITWLAVNKLGAIFVPFNTTYKGAYLQHQIRDTAARIMVVEAHYLDCILAVFDESLSLEELVCRGPRPNASMPVRLIGLEELPVAGDEPVRAQLTPHDPAIIHYTSGTTGPSKGGVMGHSYACNMGAQQAWLSDLTCDDVIWTRCPLFHGTGMFMIVAALHAGATASVYPHFSVSKFWPEIERSGATVVLMMSIMLSLVPDAPDNEASKRCRGQIRVLYGAPISGALKERWRERFGVKYVSSPGYGMTEASMVVITHASDSDVPGDASGRRFPDFDVRIVDDNGDECPPDVPGEIIIRPLRPGIMFQGYWRRPEATLAVLRDLWYWTGDIGKFDDNDYFYFLDRKKDYLRKGGENISSYEVEETFQVHPAVSEVAAHAVPSELAEDELKITIVRVPDSPISEADLHAWSIDRLPKFAVPRFIEFRDELPRTANGKVKKDTLRAEGVTHGTWDARQNR